MLMVVAFVNITNTILKGLPLTTSRYIVGEVNEDESQRTTKRYTGVRDLKTNDFVRGMHSK